MTKTTYTLKRLKTLTSYAAHARFTVELSDEFIGWIPKQIDQPYRYSPTHGLRDWHGKPVFIAETSHRRYEVFTVVAGRIYQTDDEATTMALAHATPEGLCTACSATQYCPKHNPTA